MQEREVSLREIVWKCVSDWRRMLVCAVIFAVLTTVIQYAQAQKNYKEAMETYRKQMEASETEKGDHLVDAADFTAEELQQLNDAKSLQSMLDRSRTYMQNSILMNMNAYRENVLILEYYVDSNYKFNYLEDNEPDYTSDVVGAYGSYAKNGELARMIKDNLDLDYELRYIKEIIGVSAEQYKDSFTVEIIYTDKTELTDISAIVKEALEAQTEEIAGTIGRHSLKLISENITVRTDAALANQQQIYQNMINNYRNQLNAVKNNMTDEQLEALGSVIVADEEDEEEEETEAEVELVEPVRPGFSVKYLLVGLIGGLFLSAVWSVCQILFASRLQNAEELSDVYKLRVFGVIPLEKKLAPIDSWILKMKDRHKKQMTPEKWMDVICANIELACKDGNVDKIYLTGSEWEKLESETLEQVVMKLKETGVMISNGGNVCYDMASLRMAHEIGNVILFEQEDISIYKEVEKEIKLLAEQKVNVLGCIGIG